jgi:rubrerythrin
MPASERELTPVEVLHLGIQREKDAHAFYAEMAERIQDPATREMLTALAQEELGHQRKLENWLHDNFQREM